MAAVRDKFTAGNDGNALSAANSDADTVVVTGGTVNIDTAIVWSASRSVLGTSTSTSGGAYWTRNITPTSALSTDFYIRWVTLPSADIAIMVWMMGTTQAMRLNVTPTGQLRLRDAGTSGGASIYLSTATMATGTWYRVVLYATQNATTGTTRVAFYNASTKALIEDSTLLTGRNTGASPYDSARWGIKATTSTSTATANIDDYAFDVSATGLMPFESTNPILPSNPQTYSYYEFLDLSATVFTTGPLVFSAVPSTGVVATSTGLYLPVAADGSATNYTIIADDNGAQDSMPFTAQLPADIIETVRWSGSAWT